MFNVPLFPAELYSSYSTIGSALDRAEREEMLMNDLSNVDKLQETCHPAAMEPVFYVRMKNGERHQVSQKTAMTISDYLKSRKPKAYSTPTPYEKYMPDKEYNCVVDSSQHKITSYDQQLIDQIVAMAKAADKAYIHNTKFQFPHLMLGKPEVMTVSKQEKPPPPKPEEPTMPSLSFTKFPRKFGDED